MGSVKVLGLIEFGLVGAKELSWWVKNIRAVLQPCLI